MEPFSWTALKRTLRRGEIAIEDVGRFLGLTSTASLDPDPIPLNVKIVLFGDRLLYFLVAALDPEWAALRVLADFEDEVDRRPARGLAYPADRVVVARDASSRSSAVSHCAGARRPLRTAGKLTLLTDQIGTCWQKPTTGLPMPSARHHSREVQRGDEKVHRAPACAIAPRVDVQRSPNRHAAAASAK
jgi:hypothetical protein